MSIRMRLIFSALIPIALGLIGMVFFYWAAQETNRATEQVVVADQIAQDIFELNLLSYDYLLQPGERAWSQWHNKYKTISIHLQEVVANSSTETDLLMGLQENLNSILGVFNRLVDLKSEAYDLDVATRLEKRSVGQLMAKSRMMVTDAYRLADLHNASAQKVDYMSKWLVVGVLTGVIFISSVSASVIGQSVLAPIRQLQEGTEIIAKGNLSYRVDHTRTDEVGVLGLAFNRMTEHLQTSYEKLYEEIGERKEAESQLKILNQTLEDQVRRRTLKLEERNRELDAFAYVASHDLRSPLRAIDNLAQWVIEDIGEDVPDASKRHLNLMQDRVGRLDKLLDDLLHYSRAGRYEYQIESVDTHALVQDVLALLQGDSTIQFKVADDLPVFETVKPPFQQVIQNLINNAIKYHDKKEGVVEVGWKDEDNFYHFWVADDGPGISPEFHDKVFQMFQKLQSRDEVEGTGIGLAVVKKTIEGYGGEINLISDLGQGARFEFTWPKSIDQGDSNE